MTQRLFQPSFAGGELSPALSGRVDLSKYAIGLKRCRNFLVHRTGGVSNRAGFQFLGSVADEATLPMLIPFRFNTSADQVAVLEFGNHTMRVWFQGALITDASGAVLTVATPYSAAEAAELGRVQSGDVLYLAHPNHPPHKLSRLSWSEWTFSTLDFTPRQATPSGLTASNNSGSMAQLYKYKVTAVSEKTGEESLPSELVQVYGQDENNWAYNALNTLTWTALPGIAYYRVYKEQNGLYGYVGLAAENTFKDNNVTPDISDAPPDARNPFASAGDYPALVTMHQQRLCFAATSHTPNGVWLSRSGFFENFSTSTPTKDDDAITFSLGSGEINAIRGLISVNDLIILTAGSENVCHGGNTGSALTPSSITVRPQSYWGAGRLPPLVSGNRVLFIQDMGCAVRDLGYEYSVDGFAGGDQSILSRHLLDGYSITSWAYAQVPDSTFWMVRSDGALLSLTYFHEQDLGAWALHTTPNGAFERVVVVEGEDRHALYAVVRRTVNGQPRRYVERLAGRRLGSITDAAFLDSHLVYDGSPTTTLSGLDHLEGETVGIMADGTVLDDQVVTAGAVVLPRAFSHVVVGVRYDQDAVLETLDVDLGLIKGLGSVQGRKVTVNKVTVRLEKSREFYAGPDQEHLTLTKATPSAYDAAPLLYTGDVSLTIAPSWDKAGRIVLKPAGPVPLTVLAIAPDFSIGG